VNVRAQSAASAIAAKPPFRAEHIGSLPRPAKLLRERARLCRFRQNPIGSLAEDHDSRALRVALPRR